MIRKLLKRLNKKGLSTDVLVVILLIVGLALALIIFISFAGGSKESSINLFNLTKPLRDKSGI